MLVWDAWNRAHIAKHGVQPQEAAELIERATPPFPRRVGPNKYLVRARTHKGRYLQVIYVIRSADTIRWDDLEFEDRVALEAGEEAQYVIHARDLSHGERRTVRRRTREQ